MLAKHEHVSIYTASMLASFIYKMSRSVHTVIKGWLPTFFPPNVMSYWPMYKFIIIIIKYEYQNFYLSVSVSKSSIGQGLG